MSFDISQLNTALIIICGIVLFIITVLIFFIVMLRKRNNYYLKEKELLQARFEKVLLQSQLEIQEQSFTQISAEIHDNIGQVLSLVRLNLNTQDFSGDAVKVQDTDELLGKAIADLRSLSHNLNTSHIIKAGFKNSVSFLLKSLEQTSVFTTGFHAEDDLNDLPNDKTLILFRIVQEAINNIVKHAEATKISISIKKGENNSRKIIISDNGKGIKEGSVKSGLGMTNMKQRSNLIGAGLAFENNPDGGTSIVILFNH
jgi:signal transduction histidine kinase